jgi:hypothetical protein
MTSLCTARTVKAYFANGTLPDDETRCDVDEELFATKSDFDTAVAEMNAEDARLATALNGLGKIFTIMATGRDMAMP